MRKEGTRPWGFTGDPPCLLWRAWGVAYSVVGRGVGLEMVWEPETLGSQEVVAYQQADLGQMTQPLSALAFSSDQIR